MKTRNKILFRSLALFTAILGWGGITNSSTPIHAAQRNRVQRVVHNRASHNSQILRKRFNSTVRRMKDTYSSRKKNVRSRRTARYKFPVITQHGSALSNPKYLNRVKEHNNYPLVNNSKDQTQPDRKVSDYSNNYQHHMTTVDSARNRPIFRTDCFLPLRDHNDELYSPQSISVLPNGKSAYVAYNATSSNSDNPKVKSLPFGSVQIIKVGLGHFIKVNLDQNGQIINKNNDLHVNRHSMINNDQHVGDYARLLKAGPIFKGGHGQAFAYNPKSKTLWLMNNTYGASDHPGIEQISLKTMRPIDQVKFHLNTVLGDNLTFDGHGRAINVDEAESNHTITKLHALKLFQGQITPKRVHWKLVQGIRKAPNYVIQGLAYDPHNHRIYIVGDESILSIPMDRIGRLRPRDVHQIQFKGAREFEGLSFDRYGYGYLLSNRSPEIFKSLRTDF